MENNAIIPYSQHYRCYAMMVGSLANQAVFEYMMDEYLHRMRKHRSLEKIKLSINHIARTRNMNRRTVNNAIESLCKMKLIEYQDNSFTLDGDMYVSLIRSFNDLKMADKEKFTLLLQDGNIEELRHFGFGYKEGARYELLNMAGSLNISVQNDTTLCRNTQPCAEIHNPVQNDTTLCRNTQGCVKLSNVFEEFNEKVVHFYTRLCKNAQGENEVRAILDEYLPETFGDDAINWLTSAILTPKDQWSDDFYVAGLCIFAQGVVYFCTTEIKEINNKEEIKGSEAPYIGGEKKNFFEQEELDSNSSEQEEKDNFQMDPNMMGDSLKLYELYKKKERLPYFPVSDIEEITGDIRNCLDRADKIFIFQLWQIFHDHLDLDEERDDEGNIIQEESIDVEGKPLLKEDFIKDYLRYAREYTDQIIDDGKIIIDGEELEVTATKLDGNDYFLIPGFEVQTLNSGANYIISSSRIHNIFGNEITEQPANVKTQRDGYSDTREEDYAYMQKIIQIHDNDLLWEKLSSIEFAISEFLIGFFELDENGRVMDVKEEHQYFLPEKEFRTWIGVDLRESGCKDIKKDDIVSVVFNNDLNNGGIDLRPRMFSAQKIRNWNQKHSQPSIVDEYELQDLTNNTQN